MKEVLRRLFEEKKFRISKHPNAITSKFTNTRMRFWPGHQIKPEGPKGNFIELVRLQESDSFALCMSNKARVVNGKSLTVSHIWLSDEAVLGLYMMLGEHFKHFKDLKENSSSHD